MTPQFRASIGSKEAIAGVALSVDAGFGAETKILSEAVERSAGLAVYTRHAEHGKGVKVVTQIALDAAGKVAGFVVQKAPEAAESRFLDYQTKARLALPFEGAWTVVWGGRTIGENYHAVDRAQRFALDMLVVDNGASHTGDGKALTDYHCWERPILAPADGHVVSIVNDMPDHQIGNTDPQNPAGNHVVLDVGDGEFLFLAHLKQGSVAVKQGDTVARGDQVGQCGNSGNTSEPHLHIHMQTTADLANGEGLPIQFLDYLANDRLVERGEPKQGEVVSSAGED